MKTKQLMLSRYTNLLLLACVILIQPYAAWASDSKDLEVSITSPQNGFVTTQKTVDITVQFSAEDDDLAAASGSANNLLAVILKANDVEVGRLENPPQNGSHTFSVDLSSYPEGVLHLQAFALESEGDETDIEKSRRIRLFIDRSLSDGVRVGRGGGIVSTADDKLTITIPKGALTRPQTITVNQLALQDLPQLPDGSLPDSGWMLEPDGLQFRKPVEVRLALDPTSPPSPGSMSANLSVLLSLSAGTWELLQQQTLTQDNAGNNTLTAKLSHFSTLTKFTEFDVQIQITGLPDQPLLVGQEFNPVATVSDTTSAFNATSVVYRDRSRVSIVVVNPPDGIVSMGALRPSQPDLLTTGPMTYRCKKPGVGYYEPAIVIEEFNIMVGLGLELPYLYNPSFPIICQAPGTEDGRIEILDPETASMAVYSIAPVNISKMVGESFNIDAIEDFAATITRIIPQQFYIKIMELPHLLSLPLVTGATGSQGVLTQTIKNNFLVVQPTRGQNSQSFLFACERAGRTWVNFEFIGAYDDPLFPANLVAVVQCTLPDFTGLSETQAIFAIALEGLVAGTITYEPSATVPEGNVIHQDPPPGSAVDAGATVNLVISSGLVNVPPGFTSTPITAATVGQPYIYFAEATDPNGDALEYALTEAPAGMLIASQIGTIEWTPTDADVGQHQVTVIATDPGGLSATQSFIINVSSPSSICGNGFVETAEDCDDGNISSNDGCSTICTVETGYTCTGSPSVCSLNPTPNSAPRFVTTPITVATVGQPYIYDSMAIDQDLDLLTYELTQAPAGMTIDSINSISGKINWTPTDTQVGRHPVTVTATDPGGLSATQSFIIDVPAPGSRLTNLFATLLVSTPSGGQLGVSGGNPSVSADGRYVAFQSTAGNLVVPNESTAVIDFDIFVKDMLTGTTVRASSNIAGGDTSAHSENPSISGNGRYVAFDSLARDLVVIDTNNNRDVFVRDLVTNLIWRVSTTATEAQAAGGGSNPSISADGSHVAFQAPVVLGTGDTDASLDIYVKNIVTGAINLSSTGVDANKGYGPEGDCFSPALSPDGRFVTFVCTFRDPFFPTLAFAYQVWLKDLQTGAITEIILSSPATGALPADVPATPAVSEGGGLVAFVSSQNNLVPGDTNAASDIFVKDLSTGALMRISTDSVGMQANGSSANPSVSSDGRYVVFESVASNLVADDTNAASDIFIKDLQTGAIKRVGQGFGAAISPDANYIAFGTGNVVLNGPALLGGPGDDILIVSSPTIYLLVDGGPGTDTVNIDASVLGFNFTEIADNRFAGIEKLDMSGANTNTITMNAQDILAFSNTTDTVLIKGDPGDAVLLSDPGWTQGVTVFDPLGEVGIYVTYTNGAATVLVEQELTQPF
ncbi:MAG: PASTA domain-containing protein [Nitrospirae bacterium]|nr:PASTA domain-containing protein [Nitrospirota bacterium]